MAFEKNIKTRIVLTHDEYNNLKTKHLKEGEVVLAKVGEITEGNVTQPVFMMKVGTSETTKTVAELPWLMAPAADVYDWAKKENLEVDAVPTLPTSKIEGLNKALEDLVAEDTRLAGLISGLTETKADKVTSATAGNFAGLDANGNLTDSGSKASDFAVAGHNHDDKYKKLQTAVSETGAADKTLKISQNENGDVTATAVDIAITSTQVTDFETEVKDIVGSMGIAGSEEVAGLSGRLTTAESEIDDLQTAVNTTFPEKITQLEQTDSDLDTAVKAAQADATSAKTAIEAFLKEADSTTDAIDTLKEIQAELDAGEASAASLLAEVNKIKDGTTVVPNSTDADTVDGKHASDFDVAGAAEDVRGTSDDSDTDLTVWSNRNLIRSVQENMASKEHTHTVSEITDYETDVTTRIMDATDPLSTEIQSKISYSDILDYNDTEFVDTDSGDTLPNGSIGLKPYNDSLTAIKVKGLKSAAFTESSAYATAAQGAKADTAIQEITFTDSTTSDKDDNVSGLKVTKNGTSVNIEIDDTIVFVLDGGTAANLD